MRLGHLEPSPQWLALISLPRVRAWTYRCHPRPDRCRSRRSHLRRFLASTSFRSRQSFSAILLKFLAVLVAIGAGILEEVMFRRWTMNWLMAHGYGAIVQVLGAGLLFGLLHAVWGLMGRSVHVAASAMLSTGLLCLMLGIVYLLSGRSLAPCIVAHFLINLAIEPGLVLAATRGEMISTS